MQGRSGFTIIEIMVAMLVLTVGLLALAGSAALVTRMVTQGHLDTEASTVAAQRFEILRSQPCDSISGDTATMGPHATTWTVTTIANGRARQVTVQVASPTTRGSRSRDYATTIFC